MVSSKPLANGSSAQVRAPSLRLRGPTADGWVFVADAIAASPFAQVAELHRGSFQFDIADIAIEAGKRALGRTDLNQYAGCRGRQSLLKALARMYTPLLGWHINPETEIIVTPGAYAGLMYAITAFIGPGDEVIVFEPFFDAYGIHINFAGGQIVRVGMSIPRSCGATSHLTAGWTVDMEELERAVTPRTRMLIVNSPHNPTGHVYSRQELEAIGNLCVERGIVILSDEVYEHMSFVPFTRMASISPEIAANTLTVGSAGKSLFVTGWRLGWLLGLEHLVGPSYAVHLCANFSSVSPLQEALAETLESGECDQIWKSSRAHVQQMVKHFTTLWEELGLQWYEPQGSCYMIVDMSPICVPPECEPPIKQEEMRSDFRVVWFLATRIGVGALPCSTFTMSDESKSNRLPRAAVRFALGKDVATIEMAVERLRGLKAYIHR